jgi:hypothetical protein
MKNNKILNIIKYKCLIILYLLLLSIYILYKYVINTNVKIGLILIYY